MCLLILDLNPFKSYGHKKAIYRQRIQEISSATKETLDIVIFITSRNGDRKIM